jgi:hypothetical protein
MLVSWGEQFQRTFSSQLFTSLYLEDEKEPEKASKLLQYPKNMSSPGDNQLLSAIGHMDFKSGAIIYTMIAGVVAYAINDLFVV